MAYTLENFLDDMEEFEPYQIDETEEEFECDDCKDSKCINNKDITE